MRSRHPSRRYLTDRKLNCQSANAAANYSPSWPRPPPATSNTHTHTHTQIIEQTDWVDTAVRIARDRLDTARNDLIATVGGTTGIVTEAHLHTRRAQAVRADTDTVNAARRHSRALDDHLARAETAAARALAQIPAHTFDLDPDLDQQAEVEFLHAAAAASPAGLKTPLPATLDGLDDPAAKRSRRSPPRLCSRTTQHTVRHNRRHNTIGCYRRTRPHPQPTSLQRSRTLILSGGGYYAEHGKESAGSAHWFIIGLVVADERGSIAGGASESPAKGD